MIMHRRTFLKGAAAGVVGASLPMRVAADHENAQPTHVTITYDEAYLETYQPVLDMQADDRQDFLGLYGWVASSPEHDTNVCVYWASYSHQEGWFGRLDGHYGDHEPVAVEVDKQSGDVERIRASIYHWIKGEESPDVVPMDTTGKRPRLRVINPWHQYTAAEPDATVEQFPVRDLTNEWDSWLANGMEDAVVPGASRNPWMMQSRGDWWRRGTFGVSTDAALVKTAQTLGLDETGSLRG